MSSSEEDLSYNLKTNLYGVVNTVNAFLPLLKENKQGKKQIFVTSSTLGSIGGPYGKMPVASACTFFQSPHLSTKTIEGIAKETETDLAFRFE